MGTGQPVPRGWGITGFGGRRVLRLWGGTVWYGLRLSPLAALLPVLNLVATAGWSAPVLTAGWTKVEGVAQSARLGERYCLQTVLRWWARQKRPLGESYCLQSVLLPALLCSDTVLCELVEVQAYAN